MSAPPSILVHRGLVGRGLSLERVGSDEKQGHESARKIMKGLPKSCSPGSRLYFLVSEGLEVL